MEIPAYQPVDREACLCQRNHRFVGYSQTRSLERNHMTMIRTTPRPPYFSIPAFILLLTGQALGVEPAEPKPQAPDQPGAPRMFLPRGGGQAGFEIETLLIKPADPATTVKWAELGAAGYHVVASVPAEGGQVWLLLERTVADQNPNRQWNLPAAFDQDPKAVDIKNRLAEIWKKRLFRSDQPMPKLERKPDSSVGPAPLQGK